eukprot:2465517-Karenia_brevis.AAC.1
MGRRGVSQIPSHVGNGGSLPHVDLVGVCGRPAGNSDERRDCAPGPFGYGNTNGLSSYGGSNVSGICDGNANSDALVPCADDFNASST